MNGLHSFGVNFFHSFPQFFHISFLVIHISCVNPEIIIL